MFERISPQAAMDASLQISVWSLTRDCLEVIAGEKSLQVPWEPAYDQDGRFGTIVYLSHVMHWERPLGRLMTSADRRMVAGFLARAHDVLGEWVDVK